MTYYTVFLMKNRTELFSQFPYVTRETLHAAVLCIHQMPCDHWWIVVKSAVLDGTFALDENTQIVAVIFS